MDLKEFITETISAIADSTTALQKKYEEQDIIVNPPSAQSGNDVFQAGSSNYTMRRVQNISFDVAVTAASEGGGKGKAGIKVLSVEVGVEGGKAVKAEQVSRVSFNVPITLKPTQHEAVNMDAGRKEKDEQDAAITKQYGRSRGGSWSA
ncbi:MAG: hypothetical protein GYB25_11025 [Rhodobacteraceae bacterium]|nr:hypothetical protein [Paracoccaceae bacterium]